MITSFHHVGCLVANIDEAIGSYKVLHPGGEVSPVYTIAEQQVKVCFYNICGTRIEFVEPADPTSRLYKMLQKGGNFYHVGLTITNIRDEIERLENNGYRKINLFRSEAFNNRYCSFLFNEQMHLIELIEAE